MPSLMSVASPSIHTFMSAGNRSLRIQHSQNPNPRKNGGIAHLSGEVGPILPFSLRPIAAAQLHQTSHSYIAQHFRRLKVGSAGRDRHS